MNPFLDFVNGYAETLARAKALPLGQCAPAPRSELAPNAPKVLFFAPHPDDEGICSGLAVRLMREAGMNAINVAVTLGSNRARQAGRLAELRGACHYLGFGLEAAAPNGLERINPKTRAQDPAHWAACVEAIVRILTVHRPRVVLCPHDQDWNSTHIGTHYLVVDALARMPADFACYVVETEFWGQMADPNLMVELRAADVADMVAELSFHVGEVARNPYHLSLPAWMMDNVRRGAELVGGQGGQAPDFTFAVLNRLRKWSHGRLERFYEGGKQLAQDANPAGLFA